MDVLQKVRRFGYLALAWAGLSVASPNAAMASKAKPITVSGFGLFGNAELRTSLLLLEIESAPIDPKKIDDGAFLILSRLKQSGYLDASLEAEVTFVDGESANFVWSGDFEPKLPANPKVSSARLQVHEATLYYFDEVTFEGLDALSESDARDYFIPAATLYSTKKEQAYSPSILSRSCRNLAGTLASLGYADARVTPLDTQIDHNTGATNVAVRVEQGSRYEVRHIQTQIFENGILISETQSESSATYSRFWIEDHIRELRNESYHLGFPDTRIINRVMESLQKEDQVEVTMHFEVRRGRKIVVDSVEHIGATDTKLSLLKRRAPLKADALLDVTEVEDARRALSRLGVFKRVDLSYEDVGANRRKVVFNYENGGRVEWQALAGWGSYEQGRIGLIHHRRNLFGRAQSLSLEAIQSFKSTTGKAVYTIPSLLGEFIDGTGELNYLDRQEISFDRRERGVAFGLSTYLEDLDLQLGVNYAFDLKSSSDPAFSQRFLLDETNIGSISIRASRKRTDNVLYPTMGYDVFSSVRYATPALGGEAEFHREEFGASFHHKLGSRWLFHSALKSSIVSSSGENALEIPFGERFLVGGENTVRGYQRGEAGPIDAKGNELGAEAFILTNLELEYPLLDKLNAVVFVDAARVWGSTGNFDAFDDFMSVGLGFRYRTIVGPIRLEYGHNLDPRVFDPSGTLHFSIGFPF